MNYDIEEAADDGAENAEQNETEREHFHSLTRR